MAKNQNKSNNDPALSDSVQVVSDNEPIKESDYFNDFSELFGSGEENVTVQLYRTAPKFHNGISCDGWLGNLTPGSTYETIQQQYGGGLFHLKKQTNGKFSGGTKIRIVGYPKLESPPSLDVAAVGDSNSQVDPDTGLTVKGIPVDGDADQFLKILERSKLIQAMFPDNSNQINDTLLQIALKNNNTQSDSIGDFAKLAEVAQLFNNSGGSGGGTGLMDLAKEAIGAFTKYVEATGKRPVSNGLAVRPAAQIASNDVETPVKTVSEVPLNPENNQSQGMSMNEFAEKACQHIVAGFLSEPRKTPEQAVEVLKLALPPIPDSLKEKIIGYRMPIKDMADGVLAVSIEVTPEISQEFSLHFDSTFDIFVGVSNKQ